jgi:hypothetical protein
MCDVGCGFLSAQHIGVFCLSEHRLFSLCGSFNMNRVCLTWVGWDGWMCRGFISLGFVYGVCGLFL